MKKKCIFIQCIIIKKYCNSAQFIVLILKKFGDWKNELNLNLKIQYNVAFFQNESESRFLITLIIHRCHNFKYVLFTKNIAPNLSNFIEKAEREFYFKENSCFLATFPFLVFIERW